MIGKYDVHKGIFVINISLFADSILLVLLGKRVPKIGTSEAVSFEVTTVP